jgi:hypothetical protein
MFADLRNIYVRPKNWVRKSLTHKSFASHKSTNCHISRRSATLIYPRVCRFALCETYLRTTHLDFFSSKKKEFSHMRELYKTYCQSQRLIETVYNCKALPEFVKRQELGDIQCDTSDYKQIYLHV